MSRIFFVGVFAAVFFCAFAGAGEVPLNGKVAKVTVYTSGIARVSRLAGVELPVGLSVIRSAPLPVRADISSVQVSFPGAEGVSIESVETRRILMDESKLEGARAEYLKKIEAQEDKLFEVRQKLRAVDEDMASLHETLAFIASVRTQSAQAASREMSVQQLNVDSWDKALSMTEARSIEARKKIRELTAKRRGILKLVGNEEVVLNDIRRNYPNNKYENFVYIKVLAKKAGKVQADLTYNVNGAEWEPSYRARADLEGKTLSLDIFGTVKQDSGEDWKDVVLSLSTARPDIGTDIPTLSPWYLKATGRGKVIFDGEDKPACKLIIGAGVSSEESFIGSPATVRKPVKPQPTKAVTSGAVTVFTANAKAVIPADNYRHRIPVKTIDTPIEIEHVAIPKVMPYAFIRASATNKSEVPLLPGVVDVVVGESYCGRGTIDMTSPGEVLRIGLGIDENIKVEMKILDDKVERRRRGDRVATTNVFRITAKNLSGKDVNLSIIDQIPVAQDGEIKVTYGSEARRALRGAEFPGQLQWIAQLKPGKSEQVEFDFTIEYPESWKRDLEANNRNVMVNKKQVMEKMAKEGLNNFEIENQSDAVSQEMAW